MNGAVPGPVWTPMIHAGFDEEKARSCGTGTLMGRSGEPVKIGAPGYLFLASEDAALILARPSILTRARWHRICLILPVQVMRS